MNEITHLAQDYAVPRGRRTIQAGFAGGGTKVRTRGCSKSPNHEDFISVETTDKYEQEQEVLLGCIVPLVVVVALIKITFKAVGKLRGEGSLYPSTAERTGNPGAVLSVIGIGRTGPHFPFAAFAAVFTAAFHKFPTIHCKISFLFPCSMHHGLETARKKSKENESKT